MRSMFASMWRVLTRPSIHAFENVRTDGGIGRAITFTIAVGAMLGAWHGLIHWLTASGAVVEIVTMTVMTSLRLLAGLFVAQAVLFVSARTLGGAGNFATQVNLGALVFAPLFGIVSLADVIPIIDTIVVGASMLYFIIVNIFALRVAHGGQAWRVSNISLLSVSVIGAMIGWLVMASIPG